MIPSVLADREILYFLFEDGCEACAAARPELQKFISKHPTSIVLEIRASGPWPAAFGMKVKVTPTYVFRHGAEMTKTEGAMRATDIEKWIRKIGGAL
jgi:hypothetical protein